MERTIIEKISTCGFPRSGNFFLNQLLNKAFPDKIIFFTHNAKTLDIPDCIVPIRNPYESVSSILSNFNPDKNLEPDAVATWYKRFNTKVLTNYNSLFIIDFVQILNNPLRIVENVSNYFNLVPIKIEASDLESLNKNTLNLEYPEYKSLLMEECFDLYTEIVEMANLNYLTYVGSSRIHLHTTINNV